MKKIYSSFEFFVSVTRALESARVSAVIFPQVYRDSVRDLREVRNRLFRRLGVAA